MHNLVPRLHPELRLRPLEDPHEVLYLVERKDSSKAIRVGPAAVLVLSLCDAESSVSCIALRMQKLGLTLPEGYIEGLLDALLQLDFADAVPLDELHHQVLPGSQQECTGCGRSCQGQLIGPLADSEVDRVAELLDELASTRPYLKEGAIARVPGQLGLYFNMRHGQCVFLDDDGLCAIHRHFGLLAKPAICISFPFHRVLTEQGHRVGVSITCFRQHLNWRFESGDPLPASAIQAMPAFSVYHAPFDELAWAPLDASTRERRQRFLETEKRVLDAMCQARPRLSNVIALMMGQNTAKVDHPLRIEAKTLKLAQRILARFLKGLDTKRSFLGYILELDTAIARSYQQLLAELQRFVDTPIQALSIAPQQELLAIDHLRRLFWLREVLRHQSPHSASACYLLGWLVAACMHPAEEVSEARHEPASVAGASDAPAQRCEGLARASECNQLEGTGQAPNQQNQQEPGGTGQAPNQQENWEGFGECIVAWWRFLNEDERFRGVLESTEEAHTLLRQLAAARSC
ncbi:MAG: YkgJ family cysteine cluster protein [Myxococcota bacterium]|jgi:Fe-S-cluster containining protein|nr:YkgJ family cysteine cluster protein [Myxococcota bacterium]